MDIVCCNNPGPEEVNDVELVTSVVIPVRFPAPWFREAIQSLRTQTRLDFEVVVVVHGTSVQGDLEVLEAAPWAVTRIVTGREDQTLASVLNLGLRSCSAPFVSRLDSDDLAYPQRLETELAVLHADQSVVMSASSAEVIDSNGRIVGRHHPRLDRNLERKLLWKNVITHSAVSFDRRLAISLGGYNSQACGCEDYDLWLRLANVGTICANPRILAAYRLHPNQVTGRPSIRFRDAQVIARSRRAYARKHHFLPLEATAANAAWTTVQTSRLISYRLRKALLR